MQFVLMSMPQWNGIVWTAFELIVSGAIVASTNSQCPFRYATQMHYALMLAPSSPPFPPLLLPAVQTTSTEEEDHLSRSFWQGGPSWVLCSYETEQLQSHLQGEWSPNG